MPGMTGIKVYDLATGEARDSTGTDLATITRVADALPNIDGVCVACKNVARSDIMTSRHDSRAITRRGRRALNSPAAREWVAAETQRPPVTQCSTSATRRTPS
jgi:hypothetical protein